MFKEFKPIMHVNYATPNQQTQNQNVYVQQTTDEKCLSCQQEEQFNIHDRETIKKELFSTSTNTLLPINKITQTSRPQYNSVATGTDMSQHRKI